MTSTNPAALSLFRDRWHNTSHSHRSQTTDRQMTQWIVFRVLSAILVKIVAFLGNNVMLLVALFSTVTAELTVFLRILQAPKELPADVQYISLLCSALTAGVLPIRRAHTERDGTRAETRFGFPAKRTSPFISAGVSVQSAAGSRGVRISGSNAG